MKDKVRKINVDGQGDLMFTNGDMLFCGNRLRKRIALPRQVSKCFAVFSDTPTDENWELVLCEHFADGDGVATVKEARREYILFEARLVLGKYYDRGYRYMHIEYEQ